MSDINELSLEFIKFCHITTYLTNLMEYLKKVQYQEVNYNTSYVTELQ